MTSWVAMRRAPQAVRQGRAPFRSPSEYRTPPTSAITDSASALGGGGGDGADQRLPDRADQGGGAHARRPGAGARRRRPRRRSRPRSRRGRRDGRRGARPRPRGRPARRSGPRRGAGLAARAGRRSSTAAAIRSGALAGAAVRGRGERVDLVLRGARGTPPRTARPWRGSGGRRCRSRPRRDGDRRHLRLGVAALGDQLARRRDDPLAGRQACGPRCAPWGGRPRKK